MNDLIKWLDEKTSYIDNEIKELFEKFKSENKSFENSNTHPIYCNILSYGNDNFEMLGKRDFEDENDLVKCFREFQKIMAMINVEDIFVPSIESFCMFMGWTANVYKQTLLNASPQIMDVMKMIDDYIIESQLSAGQLGFAKANITKFRTQVAGEHGSSLVTQKDQNLEDRTTKKLKDRNQLQKELESMGVVIQQIDDKKTTRK